MFDCQSTCAARIDPAPGHACSLRLVAPGSAPQKHDHVDLVFGRHVLRLRDPRRFGTLVWHEGGPPDTHPLLAYLGIEPLSPDFDATGSTPRRRADAARRSNRS